MPLQYQKTRLFLMTTIYSVGAAQSSYRLYVPEDNILNNPILDALLNPSAALQSTAEDFLDSFERAAEPALADIINCILRACGCNASVNSDEATDSDGVVDTLETLMEDVKKVQSSGSFLSTYRHSSFVSP